MSARSLDRLFGDSPQLAALADHAARLRRLQVLYAGVVPTYLSDASRVANLKLETLVIHADNSAVAAKLKQLEPRLRTEFSRQGWAISTLQFKVLPKRAEAPRPVSDRDAHLSEAGREALSSLLEELPDDSPVRAALARMLENAG